MARSKSVSISAIASILGVGGKIAADIADGGPGALPTLGRHLAFYDPTAKALDFNLSLANQTVQSYVMLALPIVLRAGLRLVAGGKLPTFPISGVTW